MVARVSRVASTVRCSRVVPLAVTLHASSPGNPRCINCDAISGSCSRTACNTNGCGACDNWSQSTGPFARSASVYVEPSAIPAKDGTVDGSDIPGTIWNSRPAAATAAISSRTASRVSGFPLTRRITSPSPSSPLRITSAAACSAERNRATISSVPSGTSSTSAAVGSAGFGGRRRAPEAFASAHIASYCASAASIFSCGTAHAAARTFRTPSRTSGSTNAIELRSITWRARIVSKSGLPGPAPTKITFPGWGVIEGSVIKMVFSGLV